MAAPWRSVASHFGKLDIPVRGIAVSIAGNQLTMTLPAPLKYDGYLVLLSTSWGDLTYTDDSFTQPDI